jgi:endopeptidase La
MPAITKKIVLQKVIDVKTTSNETPKQLLFIHSLLHFPWPSDTDNFFKPGVESTKDFLYQVNENMNKKIYGHTECKDMLQELIGKWFTKPTSSGTIIGLVGPPGVGKTLIAKTIGAALQIPYIQITLGGQNDADVLLGHSYTYSGAQPGILIKKIIEAGTTRCIVLFDELDKVCCKNDTSEIFNVLIHLTDKNTNNAFHDRFFGEITFPLNRVTFIFTYNNAEMIDPILRDRIQEIHIQPYSINDKINITKQYLIDEIKNGIGLDYEINISDNDIEYIIESYTNEVGIRELSRNLEKILLKLNINRIYKRHPFDDANIKVITIDTDMINTYIQKPSIVLRKIHNQNMIGIINGLYTTTNGNGGIVPIQVFNNYMNNKKFTLKLTGCQGKIMKESVMSAFTTVMQLLHSQQRINFFSEHKFGLHIHTPDGSIPKDGPSAGCAIAIAILSKILNVPIKYNVAITGEIEPTGKIVQIGGLYYKLYGAKKAGIELVFIPKDNENEYNHILINHKNLITEHFVVKIASHICDVLDHVFINFNRSELKL